MRGLEVVLACLLVQGCAPDMVPVHDLAIPKNLTAPTPIYHMKYNDFELGFVRQTKQLMMCNADKHAIVKLQQKKT